MSRHFRFRAAGNKIYATHALNPKNEEFLVCTVHKTEAVSWAGYMAQRLNLVAELRACGLTNEEIHALARMTYEHYKPIKEKSAN